MLIVDKIPQAIQEMNALRHPRRIVGLVPTMGALHEGHLSLVRAARLNCDVVAASVFVNPAQFGAAEDFDHYPRNLEADAALLEKEGVALLFTADPGEMYPEGYATFVGQEEMASRLCGGSRPKHFRGVLTVVLKLFNIFRPNVAYFGQKDAQQVVMIKRMVSDLNLAVDVRTMPIIREPDGLAMSSRNVYLSSQDRRDAARLYRALCAGREALAAGEKDPGRLVETMRQVLGGGEIDYVEAVDPRTLLTPERVRDRILLTLAVRYPGARLIDNMCLNSDGTETLC